MKYDSIHGYFPGTVLVDEKNNSLIINGSTVHIISANNPEEIDYTEYGIKDALVIDNTGAFRDDVELARHLKAKGAAKVLLTAPGKGVPNIVHGVNHTEYDPETVDIFSAASCTTNAIRVPVPNGSLVVLNLEVENATSKEGLNTIMKKYALEGDLVEQIQYSMNNELVSSDIVGSSAPAIYDSHATIVTEDGKNIVLYIWYDNEYGYSQQVIRLAKYIAQVRRYTYY